MAITQTGAIYKAFSFDNVSSRDYGVYITGEAVYNAPERDVEMITIPGRNGAFALDQGRFENIEIIYPAGIFADDNTNFAEAISAFRNFLCSRKGYVRLTDEYNPDEYRLAVYKSGLEVSPTQLKVGEFEIVFDCMPQRYLVSGEEAVTVSDGETLTNPTMFASSPLLEVEGYGTINVGEWPITILDADLGSIPIAKAESVYIKGFSADYAHTITLDTSSLNAGDTISVPSLIGELNFTVMPPATNVKTVVDGVTGATGMTNAQGTRQRVAIDPCSFTYGTSGSETGSVSFVTTWGVPTSDLDVVTRTITVSYDGADTITLQISTGKPSCFTPAHSGRWTTSTIYGDSSIPVLDSVDSLFIDLDIGEGYGKKNGEIVSLNNVLILPTILPTLESGANVVTFDGTIESLKITPRWWKV